MWHSVYFYKVFPFTHLKLSGEWRGCTGATGFFNLLEAELLHQHQERFAFLDPLKSSSHCVAFSARLTIWYSLALLWPTAHQIMANFVGNDKCFHHFRQTKPGSDRSAQPGRQSGWLYRPSRSPAGQWWRTQTGIGFKNKGTPPNWHFSHEWSKACLFVFVSPD